MIVLFENLRTRGILSNMGIIFKVLKSRVLMKKNILHNSHTLCIFFRSWHPAGWVGGPQEKSCLDCILETERYRKFILGRTLV